jgi:glycosyltransferase involved in cell wall biosynthesis
VKFSVLTPVFDPPVGALRAAVESVRAQTYPDWELVLVDDASTDAAVKIALAEFETLDPRIVVVRRASNGGIGAASQDALQHASGEFVALLDHDDLLAPHALSRAADALAADPEIDYLYTDEDKVDDTGRHYDTFMKPEWSPERLRGQMYTAHLSVIRRSIAIEAGGFRLGFDGSQDHDLVLRVTERARRIVHLPEVLYHWRVVPGSTAGDPRAKTYAWEAGRRAVHDHLDRIGTDGDASLGPLPGTYRIERRIPAERTISIVIPTRGSSGLIWGEQRCFVLEAVRSALEHTDHKNVEIVAVCDTATPVEVIDELYVIAGDRLTVVEYTEPFNFSRKCNAGFVASQGDVVVMLNDDVEVISDRWLENLCGPLEDPTVGLTGALLYYGDGTVQHAGHLYDRNEYSHAFLGCDPESTVAFSALHINREASGVTAACAALRRDTFAAIGGFCEDLPGNFNDVDFCFKIAHAGLHTVWLSNVELFHFESRTRDSTVQEWEYKRVHDRWGSYVVDPMLPLQHGPARRSRQFAVLLTRAITLYRQGGTRLVLERYRARRSRLAMLSAGTVASPSSPERAARLG